MSVHTYNIGVLNLYWYWNENRRFYKSIARQSHHHSTIFCDFVLPYDGRQEQLSCRLISMTSLGADISSSHQHIYISASLNLMPRLQAVVCVCDLAIVVLLTTLACLQAGEIFIELNCEQSCVKSTIILHSTCGIFMPIFIRKWSYYCL